MGVDLTGCETEEILSINWHGWRTLLTIGEEFGWTPRGTSDPYPFEEWGDPGRYFVPTPDRHMHDGSYFSNDGWWVDPEDAASLWAALEAALEAEDYTDKPVASETLNPHGSSCEEDLRTWVQRSIAFYRESQGFRIM
jgi:hypothetical protein